MAAENMFKIICEKLKLPTLNEFQREGISALLAGKDVFIGTSTGSGKSVVYQGFSALGKTTLVISPLLSIMKEQVEQLNSLGIKAAYVGESLEMDNIICTSEHSVIFSSPEAALGNKKWRRHWSEVGLDLIVMDEAHTVTQWGESEGAEQPFREWFGKVGELRSLTSAPLLALTATASPANRYKIMKSLGLNIKKTVYIGNVSDRPNIKMNVLKIGARVTNASALNWILEDVLANGKNSQRYVIFFVSRKECTKMYMTFVRHIKDKTLFNMFHSKTPDSVKEKIRQDMGQEDGCIRVLLATQAAGMGVNFVSVNTVVNFGLPKDLDSYVQQTGRAGRDGQQSNNVLLYRNSQLHSAEKEVQALVSTSACRRNTMLKFYSAKATGSQQVKHLCCDFCERDCDCHSSACPMTHAVYSQDFLTDSDDDIYQTPPECRTLTKEQLELLKVNLEAYQNSLDIELLDKHHHDIAFPGKIVHGFTDELIQNILDLSNVLNSTTDIINLTPIWSLQQAGVVLEIIRSIQ